MTKAIKILIASVFTIMVICNIKLFLGKNKYRQLHLQEQIIYRNARTKFNTLGEYKGILFLWLIKSHSLILSWNKCSCSWKGKRMRNNEQMFPILSLKKRMKNEE